jgi:uncharacterized membrane protein HdeD (DUF308 family)
MREPEWDGSYRNRVWSLALGIGAGAVLLFLQFTPRPFLATIAAILWLVALMGVAALVQIRQAHMTARRLGWIAWRIAGASYIVGAAILIADPLLGNRGLVLALAIALAFTGLARLSFALGSAQPGRFWFFLSGVVTLAIAMAIGFAWPFSLIAPAIKLLALDLLVLGVTNFLAHIGTCDNRMSST